MFRIIMVLLFSFSVNSAELAYQGQLFFNGKEANGIFDFKVGLFDAVNGGRFIDDVWVKRVKVIDGEVNLKINVNSTDNDIKDYWLEFHVNYLSDSILYHQLLPRQPISKQPQPFSEPAKNNLSQSNIFHDEAPSIQLASLELIVRDETKNNANDTAELTHTDQDASVLANHIFGYEQSLINNLTVQEYANTRRLHDSLRELINADLHQQLPIKLNEFVFENGGKKADVMAISDNQIFIDVTTGTDPSNMKLELQQIDGIQILAVASTPAYSVISIAAKVDTLFALSQTNELKFAMPVVVEINRQASSNDLIKPFSQGVANNQAEQSMEVDAVRRVFPALDGAGIKVGSLSDSINQVGGGIAASQASNDLPSNSDLNVINDFVSSSATDEGRAMMELIHDISPNLDQLGFATAFGGEAVFATNIAALSNAGMDVINDDVRFLAEPIYQDGVIAQAVNNYVNQGGIYFSSAGNYANQSYESVFSDGDGDGFHNYSGNDELLNITIAGNSTIRLYLQWAQPWGNASTDLDFEIRDSDNDVVASSTTNNIGGNPLESISVNGASGTFNYNLVVKRVSGSTNNLTFKILNFRSTTTFNEYTNAAAGNISPHAATNGIAIGASPWFNRDVAETFSSQGPHRRFFNASGDPVGPFTFDKPDFIGSDAVNTSFFGTDIPNDTDTLPNFSGTSAAAPNAAAVAALMVQSAGGPGLLDSGDVVESLKLSSIDLGDVGFDTLYGNGRIHALGAVVLAKGPQSTEFYLYPNQFGDADLDQNLFNPTDIDRFLFASNSAGLATVDVTESDGEMDPMLAVFVPSFGLRTGLDYDGGDDLDDARFDTSNLSGFIPYAFEVLSESDFSGAASFTLSVNGPDQSVNDRSSELDANGDDINLMASLVTTGDGRFYQYKAPFNGNLNVGLSTTGLNARINLYDADGALLDTESTSGPLVMVDSVPVTFNDDYFIQVVSNQYSGTGDLTLDVDFARNTFDLMVTKQGDGVGLVTSGLTDGIDCGSDCDQTYDENVLLILDATAEAGNVFVGWQGECMVLQDNRCSVHMTANKSVVATFINDDVIFANGFE